MDEIPTPYRAVGYKRVSAREQVEGHSLDAQEVHICTYVQAQGWTLMQIYEDAGISAKKGSHRPALEQLLRDAKAGKFDVVVVDKIDRFYRHLGGLLSALDQLNSYGVSFASVQEKLDFITPWGKLMLTVLGMLAEIYLDNLRQETKKGQRQRARKGMWIGGIPFGYCKGLCTNCEDPNGKDYCPNYGGKNLGDGKNIIAHPIESLAVKMVFDLYVTGHYSQIQIVNILNETKIRLPDGTEVPLRQKGRKGATTPGAFGRDIIRDMLRRVSYTGKLAYQGLDDQGRHRKRQPPLEMLAGNHPALISDELFQQAQDILALVSRNCRHRHGKPVRLYPLTGILKCGFCGSAMRGESTFHDRRVYGDSDRIDHKNKCTQPMVNAAILEEQMYEFLHDVIENSQDQVDLDVLQKEIQIAEQRFTRTRDMYISGEITREGFESERNRLESLKRDLRYDFVSATMTSLSFIRSGVAEWNKLSQLEQKRLLQLAIEAAWVRENAIVAVQPSIAFLSLLSTGPNGNSGEGGIRTHGRGLSPYTHLAGEPNRPLWHLPRLA
jgi:DNA invertase Pin-like site-specific DNA recombinase